MRPLTDGGVLVAHGHDELRIQGLRIEAVVGFSPHETTVLQPLDIDLAIDLEPCMEPHDDPSRTLDYKALKDDLRRELLGARFLLIESVAEDIARRILAHANVLRVAVTVHKPGALTGADDVSITIQRSLTGPPAPSPSPAPTQEPRRCKNNT